MWIVFCSTCLTHNTLWKKCYVLSSILVITSQSIFLKEYLKTLTLSSPHFFWHPKTPRLSMETLQLSTSQGSLALTNLCLYYYASQLIYVLCWLFPQLNNAASAMDTAVVFSYETLANLIYRHIFLTVTGTAILKVWLKLYT